MDQKKRSSSQNSTKSGIKTKKRSPSQNKCEFSRILGSRQKKSSLSQKMGEFTRIPGCSHKKRVFITKSAKKHFLLTNSGVITSILGVSGRELHSSGPELLTFFGAQAVIWGGTALECPQWRRACCKFTAVYQTVTIAFLIKRYSSKSVLLKK